MAYVARDDVGGAGESSFGIGYAADNDTDASVDLPKEKKTRTQHYIYARRDTEDGPLEIIPPQESLWYRFYVQNFYINEDVKLQKANNILSWCSKSNRMSCLIDGVGQS